MSTSITVPVSPDVLVWARNRSGKDVERKFPRWPAWLDGTAPTLRQLEEFARYTHVPFGTLLLDAPPEVTLPLPDYRRHPEARGREPSPDLLAVLHQSQRRQDWFREYAVEQGLDAHHIPRLTTSTSPVDAAAMVREMFRLDEIRTAITRTEFRRHLLEGFEELGGLGVFTSMVGNDNHRMLDRDEFRGFTLVDEIAPLIFVNAHDTLAGQIFTFFHEFAHLMLRDGGLGDENLDSFPNSGADAERETWCDAVAAETLVPLDVLAHSLDRSAPLVDELDRLSRKFHASSLVVLLQMRRGGLLPRVGFDEIYESELARVEALVAQQDLTRSGGTFYSNQPYRIGPRLARALIRDAETGRTSYTEALGLLGLRSVGQMDKLASRLGSR